MPYKGYPDGLYWLRRESDKFGFDHHAILDIGNRLHLLNVRYGHPVVVHQRPPSIAIEYFEDSGPWIVQGRIADERSAIEILNLELENPSYNLLSSNCEHLARAMATGKRESKQLQTAIFVAGVIAVVVYAANNTARQA